MRVIEREKESFLLREIGENETDFALDLFIESASQWIKELLRICRALILDR